MFIHTKCIGTRGKNTQTISYTYKYTNLPDKHIVTEVHRRARIQKLFPRGGGVIFAIILLCKLNKFEFSRGWGGPLRSPLDPRMIDIHVHTVMHKEIQPIFIYMVPFGIKDQIRKSKACLENQTERRYINKISTIFSEN